MNKYTYFVSFLFFGFILSNSTFSQTDRSYNLDDIIITSSRIPVPYKDLTRNVTVLNISSMKNIPAQNLQDILNHIAGIDLKTRGLVGVQADAGMRGGTFEQTLIMIDGIKITDAQTSHHNLNLPITLNDIERIEVLKGQGSSLFGPNAFAGVINFITKKQSNGEASFQVSGGSNGYYGGNLNSGFPIGVFSNRLSLSKEKSDGYRFNTHFDNATISFSSSANTGNGNINFHIGYTDKEFGASNFYSNRFPNQWEQTKTLFTNINSNLILGGINLSPKIFWRQNKDDYLLDFSRPSFYHNIHKTNSYGFELQSYLNTVLGSFAVGGEISKDEIVSSNLGDHKRTNWGVSAGYNSSPIENLNINVSAFLYKYGKFASQFWPGLDIGYTIIPHLKLYASVGRSFRIPSYTDLFYNSPAQIGNADLHPEEAITYESGFIFGKTNWNITTSYFVKNGKNIIDWIKYESSDPWRARNITKVNTRGIDVEINIKPHSIWNDVPVSDITLSYAYLESDKSAENLQSLYILDYLKNKFVFGISHDLPFRIKQNWTFRYCDRVNLSDYFIADTKISYSFNWFELFAQATNLFNKSYMDIAGIPLPGRWIIAGVKLSLGNN